MIFSLIVAVADNGAMGKDGQLPWHLPHDLRFFKDKTMGKPMLMGRRTFQSFPKPLPGRLHIVVSSQNIEVPDGVVLVHSVEEGLRLLEKQDTNEAFVIGGAMLFNEVMDRLDRAYITRVHTKVAQADTFFTELNKNSWKLLHEETYPANEKNIYPMTFQFWDRK